ncbi:MULTISPECIES: immunity 49 family protein [unclassified Shewanella]|nr:MULTISPECIES: immunity 49 family protein [unclassified Shewanella]
MKVERKYDPEFSTCVPLLEWLEAPRRRIKKIPVNIVKSRDNLIRFSDTQINLARWLTWEQQTPGIAKESSSALVHAAKMLAAFHQIAQQPELKHTISIAELPAVTWSGEGILASGLINSADWCEAYFCAVITRDEASMDTLANFPVALIKQSGTKAGPVSYLLVEVFQAYHHKKDNFPSLLQETMSAAVAQNDDWALGIAMGYLETFAALTTDIGFDFNEVLAKNLVHQEKYRMNAADKDVVPVASFLPIELLGMACMWHDKGNTVTVESDSLPRFLIEGTYL